MLRQILTALFILSLIASVPLCIWLLRHTPVGDVTILVLTILYVIGGLKLWVWWQEELDGKP